MTPPITRIRIALAFAAHLPFSALAQPEIADVIQVTATRDALAVLQTPASVTVIDGEALRTGLVDLRTALLGVVGVEISPGGDSGPAGAVPAIWGLREFDAFLLVVDAVPWGGAFNPSLTTLDLHNVERIEVLRGAAPVMYGATSFVGVIHVIHRAAGDADQHVRASAGSVAGSLENWSAAASTALPDVGDWQESVSVDVGRERFADAAAFVERTHGLYRLAGEALGGAARIDTDLTLVRQGPTSPYPRRGNGLDPTIDTDASHNPADARLDESRLQIAFGYERATPLGDWSSTLALSHTDADVVRGFLADACADEPLIGLENACGFAQDRAIVDAYLDTHIVTSWTPKARIVWGLDQLYGRARQRGRSFAYAVDRAHGGNAPRSDEILGVTESAELEDERRFLGLYGQLLWQVKPRVDVVVGLRLNRTSETRTLERDSPESDKRNESKPSGSIGLTWTAFSSDAATVALFADYRDTFKPAAIDFGPETGAPILDPETAHSNELGIKVRALDGRIGVAVTHFSMTMENLVVPGNINGTPQLTNAGALDFDGEELELEWQWRPDLILQASYARHDLIFGDYLRDFDGVPTQLRGNHQELAPRDVGSFGLVYAPAERGLRTAFHYNRTGSRYLNKRNTSKAPAFDVIDAYVGYEFEGWEIGLHGHNLTDSRDPISESELGDGQYYRMPARSVSVTLTHDL